MKVALVTDTHFGIKSGNRLYLDYMEGFFRDTFFPELDRRGVTTVVHLGDLVEHRKNISFYALNRVRRFFVDPIVERDLAVHLIVGNHDVPFRNTNAYSAQAELFGDHRQFQVYDEPVELVLHGDSRPILYLPWINDGNAVESARLISESRARVVLGHLEVIGLPMYRGVLCEHGLDPVDFRRFELVVSGHFHTRARKGNVLYMGNPYHLYWNDFGDDRGFAVLDTETAEVEFVDNPYTLFRKLTWSEGITDEDTRDLEGMNVRLVVDEEVDDTSVTRIIEGVQESRPNSLQVIVTVESEKIIDVVEEEDVDLLAVMNEYIDRNVESDADRVKAVVSEIYSEARGTE